MILDELILHDIGQYRGRTSIALTPPSPERPIILFGGLNGAGKTTLMEALQLCLFGPLARSSRRDGISYDGYLANLIHRGGGAKSAAVELRFRHTAHGEEHFYHVKRSWRRTAKGCAEQLEVLRNHRPDAMATQYWAEQVEEFLPARIAHLFFFDGEQIEAYADPKSSAGLIETAVYNLLGLDLVDKLEGDLSVIERRRRMETRPSEDVAQMALLVQAKAMAEEQLATCQFAHGRREAELGRLGAQRDQLEQTYRREGGDLYERRSELQRSVHEAESRFRAAERALQELAAGAAPLLLVQPLLRRLDQQVRVEAASSTAKTTDALLTERDHQLFTHMAKTEGDDLAQKLMAYLDADRAERRGKIAETVIGMPEIGRERLRSLVDEEFSAISDHREKLTTDYHEARECLRTAREQLAAVPTAEALAKTLGELEAIKAQLLVLETEQRAEAEALQRARREVARTEEEIRRFELKESESRLADEDRQRALKHIGRVRSTLEKFRGTVIRRHVGRIEALVLDSFRRLLRKESLVTALEIDPETFALRLTARDGQPLHPEHLSAGERQLLATSVLWGLARASGRPLPTVIDTPLGRLDSTHRQRLVSHYLPAASHQVILLSTDEEIAGGYLHQLEPYVGRKYQLNFDDSVGSTTVEDGYFEEIARVA